MKALITETKGARIIGMTEPLVEFESSVRIQLDTTLFLDTAGEPVLVIFADGSWGFHTALEVDELIHQPGFHQAIPVNAVIRDYINYEASKPVIDLGFATPSIDITIDS